ncbi:MAG TPA: 4-carboxy-4-hydroxy-2-oxoadipate aldolase/oxaloacetate decarboxylase [Roseiflexaceae bacterium]|nr:4-carboxy-4-hydroxy-2-oxoadipate aldolase/oxaloacetate decarboxylase [Roseiflexaceae bacterium]HMP40497.1 4-carboxy-4-hydroxy-2-oxoadipate aldolase/oxaloacetate decarboxylase [Roseiflexaceae bacterium]
MDIFNTRFERPPATRVAQLAQLASTTVYEAAGQQGAMQHHIRPIAPGMRLCGAALTVRCAAADNLTLHAAIALAEPGDVIVADVAECVEAGHWGEITTVAAQARGIAGLVINGGVRDVAPITRRGFPVFAAAISMKATVKESIGLIGHPIVCGGVAIEPGDLVLADDDGIVVVAHDAAGAVIAAAHAREEREAAVMQRLANGELTLDLLGFGAAIERRGIVMPQRRGR